MARPKKGEEGYEEANKRWRETMAKKYGNVTNFMQEIGAKGGRNGHTGGFAADPVKAKYAGAKGGTHGRRGYKFVGERMGMLEYIKKDTGETVTFPIQ